MKLFKRLSSVLALVTAAAAIAMTMEIYTSCTGGQMVTAELVHAKLKILSVPAIIWFLCAVGAAVGEGKKGSTPQPGAKRNSSVRPVRINARRIRNLRILLFVSAILLIAAGIHNGGMHDVFVKAINICSECIGLG